MGSTVEFVAAAGVIASAAYLALRASSDTSAPDRRTLRPRAEPAPPTSVEALRAPSEERPADRPPGSAPRVRGPAEQRVRRDPGSSKRKRAPGEARTVNPDPERFIQTEVLEHARTGLRAVALARLVGWVALAGALIGFAVLAAVRGVAALFAGG